MAALGLGAVSCSTTVALQRDYRVPQHAIFVREDGEPASVVEDHWEPLPLRSEELEAENRVTGIFVPVGSSGASRADTLAQRFQQALAGYGRQRADAVGELSPTPAPPNYDYPTYLRHLFASLQRSKRHNVLLFIHGGRVSLAGAVTSTEQLINEFMGPPEQRQEELPPERRDTYPICINYEADDISGYWEHVKYLRPDRRNWPSRMWSWVKIPLRAGADVGASVTRVPLTYYQDITREMTGLTYANDGFYVKPDTIYGEPRGPAYLTGRFREGRFKRAWTGVMVAPASAVRTSWSTLITTLGPGEWESFRRRTTAMFSPDWSFSSQIADSVPGSSRSGPVYLFLRGLAAWQAAAPNRHITLIGHSTGTIVAAELLGRAAADRDSLPLEFDNIVFMAAACTIREFLGKVQPYLIGHDRARFFNLSMHPAADIRESFLIGPLFYRGSLLTWLDDFLAPTGGTLDRTMGRFDNIMSARDHIATSVANRVYLRAFGVREAGGEEVVVKGRAGELARTVHVPLRAYPRRHGAFGTASMHFWEPSFWWPDPTVFDRGADLRAGRN